MFPIDYTVPIVIISLGICALSYLVFRHEKLNSVYLLLVLTAFTAVMLGGYRGTFYGLEYEDAFVFQADSRNLYDQDSNVDRYRTQVSHVNAISGKTELLSYTGHFTTFPAVIGTINHFLSYSEIRATQVNIVSALILIFLTFFIIRKLTNDERLAFLGISLILSSAVLNTFHTSALSETFSSLFIAATLYSYFIFIDDDKPIALHITCFSLLIVCALIIKRENLVLLALLPFVFHKLYVTKKLVYSLIPLIPVLLYISLFHPFSTEYKEAIDLQANTFSVDYLIAQLPVYIITILNPNYHGLIGLSAILCLMIYLYKTRQITHQLLITLGIFSGYLLTYGLHYRSRYFLEDLIINTFETFRYSTNFVFILAIISTICLAGLSSNVKWLKPKHVSFASILICALGLYFSPLKSYLIEDELKLRINPYIQSVEIINEQFFNESDPILISYTPLIGTVLLKEQNNIKNGLYRGEFTKSDYEMMSDTYFLLPISIYEEFFKDEYSVIIKYFDNSSAKLVLFRYI